MHDTADQVESSAQEMSGWSIWGSEVNQVVEVVEDVELEVLMVDVVELVVLAEAHSAWKAGLAYDIRHSCL